VTQPEELVDSGTQVGQGAGDEGAGDVSPAGAGGTGRPLARRYARRLAFALGWRGLPTTVLAVAATIAIVILQPGFLSTTQLTPFLATYAPIAILAVGVSFTLLVGGIDLSVGPVMGVCGILTVLLSSVGVHLFTAGPSGKAALCATPSTCSQGLPFAAVIIVVIAVGALFGLVNGLVIAYVRLQPLVATLAMGFVAAGFSLYMFPQPGGQIPVGPLTRYGRPALLSAPLVLLVVFTICAYLLMRTPLGVRMRAVGSHRWKAFTSGVQVPRATVWAYVASGASAGIAGVLFTLNAGSADPSVGVSYTLTAVAGAVLGGTPLRGGWAEPFGPAIGVITLGLLAELVTVANVPTDYSQLTTGLIILAGLAVAQVILRRWNKTS
jgi:ribose transport system permease protein